MTRAPRKKWELAQRSRGTLATLKAKRAALGYTDLPADRAIAASDVDDAKDNFWALQESVKQVAIEVERLDKELDATTSSSICASRTSSPSTPRP